MPVGQCTYTNGFDDYWTADHDPSVSETPNVGSIALYNAWLNTVTNQRFMCLDPTPGSLSWVPISVLPRSFSSPSFSNITAATQLSTTRDAQVFYAFPANITSIIGTQTITATLKYADNSGMSTNVVTLSSDQLSAGGILNLAVANGLQLNGIIPANKYRQVTFSVSGGAIAPSSILSSQETLI